LTRIAQPLTLRNPTHTIKSGIIAPMGIHCPTSAATIDSGYLMIIRIFINIGLSILLSACMGQANITRTSLDAPTQGGQAGAILTDADQCRIALQTKPTAATRSLDQTRMRLLNWNTQKNTDTNMQADLARLADGVDLILLQESVRNSTAFADLDPAFHWSFSPGYQRADMSTGVVTASRVKPLAQCTLTNYEPWLRSPKVTNITEFSLSGTDETLLVINLHMINFTFGLQDIRQQLLQALSLVEQHNGPVIFSGDFNTWRKARRDLVLEALTARNLEPVSYTDDYRKRVFGYALDHTFVRGIRVATGTSHMVESSDHNPMSVTLEF
jgi:endonuclease/exonuclease/phosphatase (EEP) superfamily protein YafD